WIVEVGFERLTRRLVVIALLVGAFGLLYLWLVWLVRDWVAVHVLHKHIADLDILLMLWAVNSLISLVRDVLICGVFALARLKWLTWQSGICATIALCIIWFGIPVWGAAAVLIGINIGEALNLAGILHLTRKARLEFRLHGKPSW